MECNILRQYGLVNEGKQTSQNYSNLDYLKLFLLKIIIFCSVLGEQFHFLVLFSGNKIIYKKEFEQNGTINFALSKRHPLVQTFYVIKTF